MAWTVNDGIIFNINYICISFNTLPVTSCHYFDKVLPIISLEMLAIVGIQIAAFFCGEGPRSRCYKRTVALRLIVQPCDEDD
jgi:hypothetical protein